jgi:hypothetical protein
MKKIIIAFVFITLSAFTVKPADEPAFKTEITATLRKSVMTEAGS